MCTLANLYSNVLARYDQLCGNLGREKLRGLDYGLCRSLTTQGVVTRSLNVNLIVTLHCKFDSYRRSVDLLSVPWILMFLLHPHSAWLLNSCYVSVPHCHLALQVTNGRGPVP